MKRPGFISNLIYRDSLEILETDDFALEDRYRIVYRLGALLKQVGYNKKYISLFSELVQKNYPIGKESISICEIGPGAGNILESIYQWSIANKIKVELHGIDIDGDFAALTQKKLNAANIPVTMAQGDGSDLSRVSDRSFDFVIANNMVHHIRSSDKVRDLFREIERVSVCGWLVTDLDRRIITIASMILCFPLHWSKLLFIDGIRSARRAYHNTEITEIVEQAVPAAEVFAPLLSSGWYINRSKAKIN